VSTEKKEQQATTNLVAYLASLISKEGLLLVMSTVLNSGYEVLQCKTVLELMSQCSLSSAKESAKWNEREMNQPRKNPNSVSIKSCAKE
jgi:hypothetical protein